MNGIGEGSKKASGPFGRSYRRLHGSVPGQWGALATPPTAWSGPDALTKRPNSCAQYSTLCLISTLFRAVLEKLQEIMFVVEEQRILPCKGKIASLFTTASILEDLAERAHLSRLARATLPQVVQYA